MEESTAVPSPGQSRLRPALCLFVLFFALYVLTYSGLPQTTDEMAMIAASQSFSRHGQLTANPFFWNRYGVVLDQTATSVKINFEPAQPILASALHLLADGFPRLGNVHTVLLFNVIVTALTVVLLFLYVGELGYSRATALATAAVYGTATIALPFAKTFFREPLSALSLLLAAYGLLRLARRGQLAWLVAVALGIGLAMVTKASNVFSLAVMIPIAPLYLRDYLGHEHRLRLSPRLKLPLLIMSIGVSLGALYLAAQSGVIHRMVYNFQGRVLYAPPSQEERLTALHGFLLSPGKSIFVYTPVFLACFVSLAWFWREHRREAVLCGLMALAFLSGYVYTDAHVWWAGLGWGPRFLVPVVPFLGITLAPLLARLLKRPTSPAAWPFYLLLAASLLVQAVGAAFSVKFYSDQIVKVDPQGMWGIALYDAQYSAPAFLLRHLRAANFDFAWVHAWSGQANVDWLVPLACAVVGLLSGVALRRCWRRPPNGWLLGVGGLILTVGLAFLSLSRCYDDPRYLGGPDYHALTDYLSRNASPADAIVVTNHIYTNFFLNYTKGRTEWYAVLREPRPTSDRLTKLLDGLLSERNLWLVMDNSPLPAHAELPKGAEDWTLQNAFKLDEQVFGDYCRVASFSHAGHLLPDDPPNALSASFGDRFRLRGYYISDAEVRPAPNNSLRLALYWQTQSRAEEDLHVSVQLLDAQGAMRWQADRVPAEGFWPTNTWQPGQTVRDLYTLHLPSDQPPGEYRVIVAMYDWRTGKRLPAAGSDATADYVTVATVAVPSPSSP